jgi:hypothetical protein
VAAQPERVPCWVRPGNARDVFRLGLTDIAGSPDWIFKLRHYRLMVQLSSPFGYHEDRTPTLGYAAPREAAMAAFAKSWWRPEESRVE